MGAEGLKILGFYVYITGKCTSLGDNTLIIIVV